MALKISIEYCSPCGFRGNALQLASELLNLYEKNIESLTILHSKMIGDFEIQIDGNSIFSKRKSGRLPDPGEVENLLAGQLLGEK